MTKLLSVKPFASDGTAYYRAAPYERIEDLQIKDFNPDQYIQWCDIYNVDVCFFQRPATHTSVLNIETCKRFKRPVVIDYDDNLFIITNETNPSFEYYNRDAIYAVVRQCLRLADIVTVSTQSLKEAFLKEVPEANIRVVPNAIDDSLFSTAPSYHPRNKTILLRGAGSHLYDWSAYKETFKQILATHPDYTLAVMGFHPQFLKELPADQVKYYEFSDLPRYFEVLMELRPEIMLVPLLDDEFNRSKSNIAWQEGTVAGAVAIAPNLPEFSKPGILVAKGINPGESMKWWVDLIISEGEDKYKPESFSRFHNAYVTSLKTIPKLSQINELRKDIIEELTSSRSLLAPVIRPKTTATDQEFHEYSLSHGHCQDDPHYLKAHSNLADYLVNTLRPKTAVELGSGTGATLVELLKRGVMAYGIELNPYSYQYFIDRYPMYQNQVFLADFTKEPLEVDQKGELVYSIEVLEHLNVSDEWLKGFLTDLSKKFKNFYFSSTPYHTTESWDYWWSHVNIKRTSDWIKLFEESGWKFIKNPKAIVNWDCLFESVG